jgi:hypothetical protein
MSGEPPDDEDNGRCEPVVVWSPLLNDRLGAQSRPGWRESDADQHRWGPPPHFRCGPCNTGACAQCTGVRDAERDCLCWHAPAA